jgi:hypothetical protein
MSKKIEAAKSETAIERVMSVYAENVHARIKHEELNNKKDSDNTVMIKALAATALTVDLSEISEVLKNCEVKAEFAFDKRVSTSLMCMKSIDSVNSILRFAFSKSDKLKSNVEECLRTVINFKNASKNITLADLTTALDANAKVSDDKKALIFQRKTHFASAKRHAEMTERALSALNVLKQVNREYVINDNEILKRLEARFANAK